jgi:hypothetical protein
MTKVQAKAPQIMCADGSQCPDGNTCCKLSSGEWGCCPLPNAVCCSDGEHCCPQGYTCDVSAGTCIKQDQIIPFTTAGPNHPVFDQSTSEGTTGKRRHHRLCVLYVQMARPNVLTGTHAAGYYYVCRREPMSRWEHVLQVIKRSQMARANVPMGTHAASYQADNGVAVHCLSLMRCAVATE